MLKRDRIVWAAAAVVGVMGIASGARADQSSEAELRSQLQELKAKVAAMESSNVERQEAASRSVSDTIEKVMTDANAHSKLLAEGETGAGYDAKGAYFKGTAGELRVGLQFQFRDVLNYRDEGKNGGSDIQNGFEIRRIKFAFEGWAIDPKLTYDIVFQGERNGGGISLEDASVKYQFADQLWAKGGQFKDPVFHEELTSSKRQLAVDRSMLNELLGGGATDRVQGAGVVYGNYQKDNPIYGEVIFHDGAGSRNTNFQDAPGGFSTQPANQDNFGFSGRAEYKVMGDWGDYKDFSARTTKDNLLVIGGGVDWTQGEFDGANGGNRYWGTVDAQYKMPQVAVYAAVIGDYTDFNNATANGEDNRFNWGFLVQGSYAMDKQIELYARYDMVMLDKDFVAAGAADNLSEITIGANYYLGTDGSAGHKAKFTFDVGFLPDGGAGGLSGIGILNGSESQVYVRSQFQLLI